MTAPGFEPTTDTCIACGELSRGALCGEHAEDQRAEQELTRSKPGEWS